MYHRKNESKTISKNRKKITTDQLFEFVYILIEKKKVTACQMSKHFGVSQRTIYRWVDSLSMAEVLVYAEKGKGECSGYKEDIKMIPVTLKVSPEAIYKIMDEYRIDSIQDLIQNEAQDSSKRNCGKTKIITLSLPDVYWLKSYLISFGTELEVIAPENVRKSVICEIKNMNSQWN